MSQPGSVTCPGSLKGTGTELGPTSAGQEAGLVLIAHFSTLVCLWAVPPLSAVGSSSVETFTEVLVGHGKQQLVHAGVAGPLHPQLPPTPDVSPRIALRPVGSQWSTPGFGSFSV